MSSKSLVDLSYTWDTDGWAKGNYVISAYAWLVPCETDTADNTFVDGTVRVTIAGDIDGDHDVDCNDFIILAGNYGKTAPLTSQTRSISHLFSFLVFRKSLMQVEISIHRRKNTEIWASLSTMNRCIALEK